MRYAGSLAQHIAQLLDRNVIVENRTGGDGLIGIKAVKGASPDGTTILMTTGPTMYLLPMVETVTELQYGEGFRAGVAARPLRIRDRRKPGDRSQGLQGAGGLAQGQPGKASYGTCRATAPFRISGMET